VSDGSRALITGLTGQDGSLLADALLADGWEVHGSVRGGEAGSLKAAEHLKGQVHVHDADLLAPDTLRELVRAVRPDALYHLAAPSFAPASWTDPAQTVSAIAGATATLLCAVRDHSPATRVLVASSAAMFGDAPDSPQNETTPPRPQSPYGTAKLAAHQLVGQLRRHDGLFACSAILYNHESERRPEAFVTRKVTRAAAAIKLGLADHLSLGDTSAVRDWSDARDIIDGCRRMLESEQAADYVLASGAGHTVQEFVEVAFARVGLAPARYVQTDPTLLRAPEPVPSVGDATRARQELGWAPAVSFEQLVHRLVDHDLQELASSTQPTQDDEHR
jgi:GDPmannose 4,6-dehydratase